MDKQCTFDGCYRKLNAKGLCKAHYSQQRNGKPLTPIGSTNRGRPGPRPKPKPRTTASSAGVMLPRPRIILRWGTIRLKPLTQEIDAE